MIRSFRLTRALGSTVGSGFTLLEVVVTLVLIGLAAALVAPSIRSDPPPKDELQVLLAQSREQAVRRAQTLVLQVDEQGTWQLVPTGVAAPIGRGSLTSVRGALTLRISPLGACFAEHSATRDNWDTIACGPAKGEPR